MKFKTIEVSGWHAAITGMRNPLESWTKSDSKFLDTPRPWIGDNDLNLMTRLVKAGPEHRKFLRYIHVQFDMTAPLYVWKEMDTYKIGTVANSTSTMHKLASTPITLECFEIDDFDRDLEILPKEGGLSEDKQEFCFSFGYTSRDMSEDIIDDLETLRQKYLETKDVRYWKELIRWLPESWLQTRTIDLNYEVLRTIVRQRKNHKLSEWSQFINWVHSLPYANELIFIDETNINYANKYKEIKQKYTSLCKIKESNSGFDLNTELLKLLEEEFE